MPISNYLKCPSWRSESAKIRGNMTKCHGFMCVRYFAIRILFVVYLGLVVFALFNRCNHCVVTPPESLMDKSKVKDWTDNMCKPDLEKLGVHYEVVQDEAATFEAIKDANPHVKDGGKWAPSNCKPWQKVALILCYRDREWPLQLFLQRIHPMLQAQMLDYQIFLVEQSGTGLFNRGKLFNVGYLEAMKQGAFDCIVFHDVDLIPEDDRNLYMCNDHARHLVTAADHHRFHLRYYNYAGGVVAVGSHNFKRINGFANIYWGWGNEDDDFSSRMTASNMLLTRPPTAIGRYHSVPHMKISRFSKSGNSLFLGWRRRWKSDGLNDPIGMAYTVLENKEMPLFTRILVDVGGPPDNMDDIRRTHPEDVSIWWFLTYFYP